MRQTILQSSWIVGLLLLFIASTSMHPGDLKRFEINGYAQGTTYKVTYYAADSLVTQSQTDSLLAAIDSSVSLYRPASLILKFNHSEKGISVDHHFAVLVKKALEINRETGGLVDITVKPLVDAWGFGANKTTAFPDSAKVKAILKHVGGNKIRLKGEFLYKSDPQVQIDLNGIAQGYTADLLAGLLDKNGIHNYVAEIGGELRIKGRKPDGEPFRIGIEAIDDNDIHPSPLQMVIAPGNAAVTTSGNYRKHLQANGRQISHIIDPKTGYPSQTDIISVTVVAKDGITADGLDNGFVTMGMRQALDFIAKRGNLAAYIIYKKPNGSIADTATSNFKAIEVK
ncbi:FAD:protein FMN transferase [Mucilaginibacter sp. 21P]|uniref:FAD:protein FMN transferase n=1 Tax=Mucilaginibacter sp. 21P TaxID=2778902 RepID=UPI00210493DB|nr:FAD:protein FMN transferase [Mucilaginibacter sp. 21P]